MKGRLIVLAREKWSRALAVESYIPSWGGCDFTDLAPNEAEVRNGSSVDVPNTPKRTQWLGSSSTGKRFGRAHFAARSKRVAGAGGIHGAVTLCRLRGL
jgi:hypothetical protein